MKKLFIILTFASMIIIALAANGNASTVLQNDNYSQGDSIFFGINFVSGEIAASTLGTVATLSNLDNIQIMFGGSTSTENIRLIVFEESGNSIPGNEIFSNNYTLTGSDSVFQIIDLSSYNIQLSPGEYRIGIEFYQDAPPTIGLDVDGIQDSRNWIYSSQQWYDATSLGVGGDWVIRAEVSTVPIPGAIWLLGSGIIGFLGIRNKVKKFKI